MSWSSHVNGHSHDTSIRFSQKMNQSWTTSCNKLINQNLKKAQCLFFKWPIYWQSQTGAHTHSKKGGTLGQILKPIQIINCILLNSKRHDSSVRRALIFKPEGEWFNSQDDEVSCVWNPVLVPISVSIKENVPESWAGVTPNYICLIIWIRLKYILDNKSLQLIYIYYNF